MEEKYMIVILPDGRYLLKFAEMLRKHSQCYTFVVQDTHFLCPGHPKQDPKKPERNLEPIGQSDPDHAENDKTTDGKKTGRVRTGLTFNDPDVRIQQRTKGD